MSSVQEIRCPACGATHKATENTLLVICEYCGAFVGLDDGIESRVDMTRRAADLARNPTEASVRFNELCGQMTEAAGKGDREQWRALAQEYYSLQAVLYPESVPARGREAVRDWIRDATSMGELNHFDPSVKHLFDEYSRGFRNLHSSPTPVQEAHHLLEVCMDYNRAIQTHPHCPSGMAGQDPRRLAVDTIKSSLKGMSGVMGPETVERIKTEVLGLGDEGGSTCPECGAPLTTADGDRCPYCGSRLEIGPDDLWVHEQTMLFEQVRAATPSFSEDMALNTAMGLILNTVQRDGSLLAARAVHFLQNVIPGTDGSAIESRARQMLGGHPEFLDALREALSSWPVKESA